MPVHTVKKLEWKHADSEKTKLMATGGTYDDGTKVLTLTGVTLTGITGGSSVKNFDGTITTSVFQPNLAATQSKTVVKGPTLSGKKATCTAHAGANATFHVKS